MIGSELQRAQYAALTAAGIASGRVYDKPPSAKNRVFPDVTLGDEQAIEDGNSCEDGWDVASDVHVWSRPDSGSKLEAKQLIAAIVPVLAVPLSLDGFRIVSAKFETSRVFWDPDGVTVHGVATFRYLIDPA